LSDGPIFQQNARFWQFLIMLLWKQVGGDAFSHYLNLSQGFKGTRKTSNPSAAKQTQR
jgi:hypothetical protein